MRILFTLALLAFATFSHANPVPCGSATFDVEYEPIKASPLGYDQVTLKISNGQNKVIKQFEFVYFEIACLKNPSNKLFIVYQAYCGGSACRDFDNWGIVEPATLKILIEPDDHNHKKAEKIFGGPLKPF